MYKDRWKTKIEAGRRRKPDSIAYKYRTTENILRVVGVATVLGVLGVFAPHISVQNMINKLKPKRQEPEMTLFSL